MESLENFVKSASSGRAEFTQTVTAPVKEGQTARSKTSSGTFAFSRPNRFRFLYQKPFEQTILADGQTLWLYDADLNQVTARKQATVLGNTPAALIAAAPDLQALKADFDLVAAPAEGGLDWVLATPKVREGQLQTVRVGFVAAGAANQKAGDLAALEIVDSFGQRSVMRFTRLETNPALPKDTFQFTPPKGADVIRQ